MLVKALEPFKVYFGPVGHSPTHKVLLLGISELCKAVSIVGSTIS